MLRSIALCAAAFSGAYAQFDETDDRSPSVRIPEGLSPACANGLDVVTNNYEYLNSSGNYHRFFDLMCTSVSLVPNFSPQEPYEITPCNQGIELIENACPAAGGWVCEIDVFQRVTNISSMVRQHQQIQLGVCLPQSCTSVDYARYVESRETIIRGIVQAEYPATDFNVDISGAMLCRQNDLPANFGTGFQTAVTVGGRLLNQDSRFTVSCTEGCDPTWSVDVDVITLMTPTEVGVLIAAFLNENERFEQSGCLAKYALLRGNSDIYGEPTEGLNVFCPNDARIMISQNGATPARITDFDSQDGMTFSGSSSPFDSNAGPSGSASAVAPGATLILASVASALALGN